MTSEKPTRTIGNGIAEDYTEHHPAYGAIGASRVSSTPGATLFGSDFRHQHYVVIRVQHAHLTRGLSNDHVGSEGAPIVEVALSEAQWATFVSTMNIGIGTPCTIQRLGVEEVPRIERVEERRERYGIEVNEKLQEAIDAVTELRDSAPNKRMRSLADVALLRLTDSLPWVAKQYAEHAENVTEKAKVEVSSYVTQAIQRAGLQALGVEAPFELEQQEEPE
jgi:hypothetical protein